MSVKSPEEREHLNYLGLMLSRPNTPFEQAVEDALAGEEASEGPSPGRVGELRRLRGAVG